MCQLPRKHRCSSRPLHPSPQHQASTQGSSPSGPRLARPPCMCGHTLWCSQLILGDSRHPQNSYPSCHHHSSLPNHSLWYNTILYPTIAHHSPTSRYQAQQTLTSRSASQTQHNPHSSSFLSSTTSNSNNNSQHHPHNTSLSYTNTSNNNSSSNNNRPQHHSSRL